MCEVLLPIEIVKRLQKIQDELRSQGVKLTNGKLVKDRGDVITYLLDHVEPLTEQKIQPEKSASPKRTEGWWRREGIMKKFHYFVDGRSLCRGYGWPDYTQLNADTGNVEAGKEDCAACFRKLVKRRETLGVKKIE